VSRILVDTNVLISFLTDRDLTQQELAATLFSSTRGEDVLLLTQAVLTELVYVLTNVYALKTAVVAGVLRDLLAMPGVEPVDGLSWSRVLDLFRRRCGTSATRSSSRRRPPSAETSWRRSIARCAEPRPARAIASRW
jgi:hypothetical protein